MNITGAQNKVTIQLGIIEKRLRVNFWFTVPEIVFYIFDEFIF